MFDENGPYLIQYFKNRIFGIRKPILYIDFFLFCAIFLVTDYIYTH